MKHRPEYDRNLIGKNLRRLREAKNLSVEEVKEYLRLGSVQAIYKYESGQSYPQTDTMFALMELYEAELNDIIREPQDEKDVYKRQVQPLKKELNSPNHFSEQEGKYQQTDFSIFQECCGGAAFH